MLSSLSSINETVAMKFSFSLWFLAIFLTGCANSMEANNSDSIAVDDVISHASDFDEKIITIKGWASVRPEDYGIWASEDDYKKRNWRRCISLLNFYSDKSINKSLDQKVVLITGKFMKDIFHDKNGQEIVRMGTCSQYGIRFIEPSGLRKF